MGADQSVKRVRVNRLALVLLTVIATVVGLLPVVLVLGRPQLLLYFGAGSVVVAALYSFTLEKSVTHPPSFLEFLLGGVGAIFLPAFVGILCLIAYGVIYGATRLTESLAVSLGFQLQPNADLVAFYPTVILAALFGVAVVVGSEQSMADQLYPDTAGIKSAFYELLTQKRRDLLISIAVALFVLGAALALFIRTGNIGTWFYVFLQSYLFFVTAPLSFLGEEPTPREAVDAVEAVSKLFEAAGYRVRLDPRTRSADIDPLLISLDLFARKGGHNVFAEVKTASQSTKPVSWRTAAGLAMATRALSEYLAGLGELDLSSEDVDSLLVLVDAQEDESLEAFSLEEEGIKVVRVAMGDLRGAVEEETSVDELQEAARRLLGV